MPQKSMTRRIVEPREASKRVIRNEHKANSKYMRSSKSRSRSKSNRNRPPSGGNVINRVFDSSGPEGKVRGTPQQIIDKYNQLARDAQLSNDRVATENFFQHAEHYTRLLTQAQREIDQRREEQERQNRDRQSERDRERQDRDQQNNNNHQQPQHRAEPEPQPQPQPEPEREPETHLGLPSAYLPESSAMAVADVSGSDDDSGLVETPESAPKKPARRPRTRKPAPVAETPGSSEAAE